MADIERQSQKGSDRLKIKPAYTRSQAPLPFSPNLTEVDYSKYPPTIRVRSTKENGDKRN